MAEINLQQIHDTLVSIAFEAGDMILAANPNTIQTGTKLNSVDIVTETDKAVEKLVSTRLRAAYPAYQFVGEETYVAGTTRVTDAPTFVVDPIDGTTNFVHGFPSACVSLGFALARRPAVGVVYNPFQDLLFTGIRGRGSYVQRNAALALRGQGQGSSSGAAGAGAGAGAGARLRLPLAGRGDAAQAPALGDLSTALVAVEWGSARDGPNFETKAATFRRLAATRETGGSMVHSLRSVGSAALNLCSVAAGEADLYWEGGCYAWDVCAGWCILSEAGGLMASGNPGDWDPAIDGRVYLAVRGAPSGQKEIVQEFWDVIGKENKMDYQH